MKIVHLVEDRWPHRIGGVELFVEHLSHALGRDSCVIAARDVMPLEQLPSWPITQLFNLRQPLGIPDADIWHVHQLLPWGIPFLLAQSRRIPILFTVHDWFFQCQKVHLLAHEETCTGPGPGKCASCYGTALTWPLALGYQWVRQHLVDHFLAKVQLAFTQAEFAKTSPLPSIVLPYAIADSRRDYFQKRFCRGGRDLLFLGHEASHKGWARLLQDLRAIGFGSSGECLHGFGRLSPLEELGFARVHGPLSEQVSGLPVRALILPSLWKETGPLVVHEALSAHIPVIARRGSLSREMETLTGVQTYDSLAELRRAIAASDHVEVRGWDRLVSWEQCLDLHREAYARLLESARLGQ